MEVCAMGSCGIAVELDGGGDMEALCTKAERQPAASGEEIKHARRRAGLEALDFGEDGRISHDRQDAAPRRKVDLKRSRP